MQKFRENCISVEYSSLKRKCRFSSFVKSEKINLIDDSYFDFYKFLWRKFILI